MNCPSPVAITNGKSPRQQAVGVKCLPTPEHSRWQTDSHKEQTKLQVGNWAEIRVAR